MKIAVFGTPALAAELFEAIYTDDKNQVVLAVTTPDAPAGRGNKLQQSPVKVWAEERGIPVRQPQVPDATLVQELLEQGVELLIVISYGKILRPEFLENAPPAWNLHFSVLPEYRGAAPVQSAILDGKKTSGLSIFRITAGLDTGPVIRTMPIEIADLRADEAFEKMLMAGQKILTEALVDFAAGKTTETEQNHSRSTQSKKISKNDGLLNPHSDTAGTALRKIRAFYPWPSAWIERDGKRIKFLNATEAEVEVDPNAFLFQEKKLFFGFAEKALEILEIQLEGKRVMSGTEFGAGLMGKS